MVTELKKGVYWVGVVDWGLKKFHGHELSTHRGSSYNAYLIQDEKTVLVDTVWGPFRNELIENIREIIDPGEIDIVVANHAESDHSGGLPAVMRHNPDAEVVVFHAGTTMGDDGTAYTAGGRVLNVTATGPDYATARERVYEAVSRIDFEGMQYRKDIALRAVGA